MPHIIAHDSWYGDEHLILPIVAMVMFAVMVTSFYNNGHVVTIMTPAGRSLGDSEEWLDSEAQGCARRKAGPNDDGGGGGLGWGGEEEDYDDDDDDDEDLNDEGGIDADDDKNDDF